MGVWNILRSDGCVRYVGVNATQDDETRGCDNRWSYGSRRRGGLGGVERVAQPGGTSQLVVGAILAILFHFQHVERFGL